MSGMTPRSRAAKKRATQFSVSTCFIDRALPPDSVPARCLALRPDEVERLADYLVRRLPYCYVTKTRLNQRTDKGFTTAEVLGAKFPDRPSVMAGDFGEILTMFFLQHERPEKTRGIRKWRFKEDRNSPAKHSDVIILYRDKEPSPNDFAVCAEAKLKSTTSKFAPIDKAIAGMERDRKGRLTRTLTWLREKAIEYETPREKAYIERFIEAGAVVYKKHFHAVAVIDTALLDGELCKEVSLPNPGEGFDILVLGLDDLKDLYERVYVRALDSEI